MNLQASNSKHVEVDNLKRKLTVALNRMFTLTSNSNSPNQRRETVRSMYDESKQPTMAYTSNNLKKALT